jgi:hypothetical protein
MHAEGSEEEMQLPISRYIAIAVVRCFRACWRSPLRRCCLPKPKWQ